MPEQLLHLRQPGIAFDGEMERLALQSVVAGVEEGDDGAGLTEVAPRGLDHVALPARLFGRR